jgi:hypothetical protein
MLNPVLLDNIPTTELVLPVQLELPLVPALEISNLVKHH